MRISILALAVTLLPSSTAAQIVEITRNPNTEQHYQALFQQRKTVAQFAVLSLNPTELPDSVAEAMMAFVTMPPREAQSVIQMNAAGFAAPGALDVPALYRDAAIAADVSALDLLAIDSLDWLEMDSIVSIEELDQDNMRQVQGRIDQWARTGANLDADRLSGPPIQFLRNTALQQYFKGTIQANAQILKLRIGEPTGVHVPLYFLVSASGNTGGGDEEPNQPTAISLVNPVGGTVNVSINNTHALYSAGRHTKVELAYQASAKLVSGTNTEDSTERVSTVAGYGDFGIFFQTGAWDTEKADDVGVFWAQAKLSGTLGDGDSLRELLGPEVDSAFLSYAGDVGLEIGKRITVGASIYGALTSTSASLLDSPYVKVSFDYATGGGG